VTAYSKGVTALPLVLALLVITTMVWYLIGVEHGSPLEGIASTVFGFVWVGLLGAFAALILAPSQYPHRHGVAFLLARRVPAVGSAYPSRVGFPTWQVPIRPKRSRH
jgi:ABC-type transport system involved in cytochrome bd biosynthesis fused ATPase/permease subunit